jgi:hypothetical protein
MTQAGPGSYPGIDKSTLVKKGPSKTREKTLNRRLRDCRPLTGPAATLSLHGADRLLYEHGPESYDLGRLGCFENAKALKNFGSAVFNSQTGRFPPTRVLGSGMEKLHGDHEDKKYHRTIPKKGFHEDGIHVDDERAKIRAARQALLAKAAAASKEKKERAAAAHTAGEDESHHSHSNASHHSMVHGDGGGGDGRISPTFGARAATPVQMPFDGTIDWDRTVSLPEKDATAPPPPAQFKNFAGWRDNLKPLVFDGGMGHIAVRPWTNTHMVGGGGGRSGAGISSQGSANGSVRFSPVAQDMSSYNKPMTGMGDGTGEREVFTAGTFGGRDTALEETVRFKEKKQMLYPWMKEMYKEVISKDVVEDMGDVAGLDTFKPPNTKSMRFY